MNKKSSDSVGVFFSSYLWLKEADGNYKEKNTAVLDRAGVPLHRRIYVSETTPTVMAVFSHNEAEKIKLESDFLEFTPYNFDVPLKKGEEVILGQIGVTVEVSEEYSGTGVKIGVISAEGLGFDPMAKSLEGIKITALPSLIPSMTDRHPTAVISEIVGKTIETDGTTFFGAAKDCDMYFASTRTTAGVYSAIEEMVRLGVSVINYSAGKESNEYSSFDRQIDRLIRANNILFVTASGNRLPMTSPARAYNCIAVGNAVTKAKPNTALSKPWRIWCESPESCSGFNAEPPHKPDMVAPGAWIGFVDRNGKPDFNSFGTSFACPWVSAIAASLIPAFEKKPSYLTLKALLLLSADKESVDTENDPTVNKNGMRLRSGYGIVNMSSALKIIKESYIFESNTEDNVIHETVGKSGDTLEVMLVFDMSEAKEEAVLNIDGESFVSDRENTLLIKKRSRESVTPMSVTSNKNFNYTIIAIRKP